MVYVCLCLSEPWLVGLSVAPYDLDNLRLDQLPAANQLLHLEYSLEHLLINGQCLDTTTAQLSPPAGLQLKLSSPSHPYAADTVVMQNLGYFQLQASPGVWTLSFPGRHAEIYELHPTLNERQKQVESNTDNIMQIRATLHDSYMMIDHLTHLHCLLVISACRI